mmetsp:Transcript_55738/g.118568  ORF Transcript_55738/g.118568 Transcript_55738/m.118568 type:complete len:246 (-) Transcript_55738:231-968(-)|eukprot:CAMPEP_0172540972 /NCGR_PEP_ID=MMETSP1067-20121228/11868_1 /TAXON_ID=265564 ORGANISM="Thalassiosira punctigera, Strain Tpunct2005C2" /NCGR_SAMPLE_ID=MMETSP1067 /ASSEMBLY_ACC=CAM_ASM_000444 /LENGTH=245 /DNA_ID=CAMNT_0013326917 /DNA_START=74 /DNA_END=811 /DNA_ORIENTATION=-
MAMATVQRSKRSTVLRHLLALSYVAYLLLSVSGVAATDEAGTKYLEEKSTEADVLTLPSGLRYKVLEKGGGFFHPTVDSKCVCHYAGTFIDGSEFDSSYSRGKPSTFAPNQVIKGWTEAMQLMVEGDKWELYIPSDLAYGSNGKGPIPADTALVFTIEMIEIQGGKVPAVTADDTDSPVTDHEDKEDIMPSAEPDESAMGSADPNDTELDDVSRRNSSVAFLVLHLITPAFSIFCTLWLLSPDFF